MTTPIRRDDRLSTVLERDPRLLDTLLAASPAFSFLNNPATRKTMASLSTVAHAARVAGIDADALLARLNAALTGAPLPAAAAAPAPAATSPEAGDLPAAVREREAVECDVREALRKGQEPFAQILAAARSVGAGQALHLRAIFEPAPLYAVLGRLGFVHFTRQEAADDWHIWFWREDAAAAAASASAAPAEVPGPGDLEADANVVVLDVRGLEPPEPMVRTLAALESLPPGATLVQLNERVPQFLLPRLEEHGFVYEIREQSPDLVRIFIRHPH
ncbi:MAG: DUF2249 domain-containing protein [Thermoanaerobaculia bacterium]|nr:DUF2249 domain-containing protein [Thermoanaerobaculia bacterium]